MIITRKYSNNIEFVKILPLPSGYKVLNLPLPVLVVLALLKTGGGGGGGNFLVDSIDSAPLSVSTSLFCSVSSSSGDEISSDGVVAIKYDTRVSVKHDKG